MFETQSCLLYSSGQYWEHLLWIRRCHAFWGVAFRSSPLVCNHPTHSSVFQWLLHRCHDDCYIVLTVDPAFYSIFLFCPCEGCTKVQAFRSEFTLCDSEIQIYWCLIFQPDKTSLLFSNSYSLFLRSKICQSRQITWMILWRLNQDCWTHFHAWLNTELNLMLQKWKVSDFR